MNRTGGLGLLVVIEICLIRLDYFPLRWHTYSVVVQSRCGEPIRVDRSPVTSMFLGGYSQRLVMGLFLSPFLTALKNNFRLISNGSGRYHGNQIFLPGKGKLAARRGRKAADPVPVEVGVLARDRRGWMAGLPRGGMR